MHVATLVIALAKMVWLAFARLGDAGELRWIGVAMFCFGCPSASSLQLALLFAQQVLDVVAGLHVVVALRRASTRLLLA